MKDPKYNHDKHDNPIHPFTTPDGYFEDFKAKMLHQIRTVEQGSRIEKEPAPKPTRLDILKPYLYLAAMFVGMLLMFKVFDTGERKIDTNENASLYAVNDPETTDLSVYSEEDIDEFLNQTTSESFLSAYIMNEE